MKLTLDTAANRVKSADKTISPQEFAHMAIYSGWLRTNRELTALFVIGEIPNRVWHNSISRGFVVRHNAYFDDRFGTMVTAGPEVSPLKAAALLQVEQEEFQKYSVSIVRLMCDPRPLSSVKPLTGLVVDMEDTRAVALAVLFIRHCVSTQDRTLFWLDKTVASEEVAKCSEFFEFGTFTDVLTEQWEDHLHEHPIHQAGEEVTWIRVFSTGIQSFFLKPDGSIWTTTDTFTGAQPGQGVLGTLKNFDTLIPDFAARVARLAKMRMALEEANHTRLNRCPFFQYMVDTLKYDL